MECARCGGPIKDYNHAVHEGCALLEPCSNCEQWVDLEDLPLTDDIVKLGGVRVTRCPECGDEVMHPPTPQQEAILKAYCALQAITTERETRERIVGGE